MVRQSGPPAGVVWPFSYAARSRSIVPPLSVRGIWRIRTRRWLPSHEHSDRCVTDRHCDQLIPHVPLEGPHAVGDEVAIRDNGSPCVRFVARRRRMRSIRVPARARRTLDATVAPPRRASGCKGLEQFGCHDRRRPSASYVDVVVSLLAFVTVSTCPPALGERRRLPGVGDRLRLLLAP